MWPALFCFLTITCELYNITKSSGLNVASLNLLLRLTWPLPLPFYYEIRKTLWWKIYFRDSFYKILKLARNKKDQSILQGTHYKKCPQTEEIALGYTILLWLQRKKIALKTVQWLLKSLKQVTVGQNNLMCSKSLKQVRTHLYTDWVMTFIPIFAIVHSMERTKSPRFNSWSHKM